MGESKSSGKIVKNLVLAESDRFDVIPGNKCCFIVSCENGQGLIKDRGEIHKIIE